MSNERAIVLIVEDVTAEASAPHALESLGYRVERVCGAERGLWHARHGRPSLVVLDLAGPELDGWEAARRLKADPLTARIPVIVLTEAAAQPQVHGAACDACHAKPVAAAALLASVSDLLAPPR